MIFHAGEFFVAEETMEARCADGDEAPLALAIGRAPTRSGLVVALSEKFRVLGYLSTRDNVTALLRLLDCSIVQQPDIVVIADAEPDIQAMAIEYFHGRVPLVVVGAEWDELDNQRMTTRCLAADALPGQFHDAVAAAMAATVEYGG